MSSPTPMAAIFGCEGLSLTQDERRFLADADPWGFIVFKRNIDTPDQLRGLIGEVKSVLGRDELAVLVDQEGGRVARLRPPHWSEFPPAAIFGTLHGRDRDTAREALALSTRLMAREMRDAGITVDCVPVVDVRDPHGHDVIGDRAYGEAVDLVSELARLAADNLMAEGVLPVIKHIPGHGRAAVDSHFELPVVTAAREDLDAVDFAAFRPLADLPLAMTAHVVYEAVDKEHCATLSPVVISQVIRAQIGFGGLLMTDDLSMKALGGTMAERVEGSLAAGCDMILHCNGDMAEMQAVAGATPRLAGPALARAEAAMRQLSLTQDQSFDVGSAWDRLRVILRDVA